VKTILSGLCNKLGMYAGIRTDTMARAARIILWLTFAAACNVTEAKIMLPRAVQGIVREMKGV